MPACSFVSNQKDLKRWEIKTNSFYHHTNELSDMIVLSYLYTTENPHKMKSLTYWQHQTGENDTYYSARSIHVNPTSHHLLRR